MIKLHLLNEQQREKIQKFTKQNNINIEHDEEKKKEVIEETKPIKVPDIKDQQKEKPKRKRRTKVEMAEYRKAREERVLKKAELKKANDEFKKQKQLRRESMDPEKIKAKKEKLKASPYRKFVKEFSVKNKGKYGKSYAKELSKAWKAHKATL